MVPRDPRATRVTPDPPDLLARLALTARTELTALRVQQALPELTVKTALMVPTEPPVRPAPLVHKARLALAAKV